MSGTTVFDAKEVPFRPIPWGHHRVLVGPRGLGAAAVSENVEVKITRVPPGAAHTMHMHPDQDEILYVLSGRGVHESADGRRIPLEPGMVVYIPKGVMHANSSDGEEAVEYLVIKVPPTREGVSHDVR